jgi:hypothetical protein
MHRVDLVGIAGDRRGDDTKQAISKSPLLELNCCCRTKEALYA